LVVAAVVEVKSDFAVSDVEISVVVDVEASVVATEDSATLEPFETSVESISVDVDGSVE
jgi:hypothetical protein